MKKILLVLTLLASHLTIYSQETSIKEEPPFYQYNFEKHIVTVNLGLQGSARLDSCGLGLQFFPSIPINVDIFYRYTSANIFGYSGLLVELPFFNDRIADNVYGGVFIGIGWYVFDRRDTAGVGWSMMQALAGGFFVFPNHLGGGARLISRFNYSFREKVALNLGLDFDYSAVGFDTTYSSGYTFNELFHTLNIGLSVGLTFYLKSIW